MLWHKTIGAGGLVGGAFGPSVVSSDTYVDEANDNGYNFTPSLSGDFEHIVVCCGARKATSGSLRFDSVLTYAPDGGSEIDVPSLIRSNTGGREAVAIYVFEANDTTPDILVELNAVAYYFQAVVLGVTGLTSTTAVDTATDNNLPFDLDANTVTGGMIVSCHRDRSEEGGLFLTYTNTGIDVASKLQARGSDGTTTVFFEAIATGETPRDIQIDSDSTTSAVTSVLASLQ
jgi:hypothetical protein